jgi:RND family efflux transporter MFP subunit
VELGERVNPGARLFGLLDPDSIEVPIELPVSLRDRVSVGSACRLKLESNEEVSWSGQVARIAPSAARATRTFSLFVEVDNTRQQQPLMPGLFVRAGIEGPVWRDALVIPRGIVQREHVFVYDNGLARRRVVKIERHLLDQTVVSGLRAGEIVITSNLDALFDGATVRLQPSGTAARDRAGEAEAPAKAAPAGAPPESEAVHGS